MKTIEEAAKVMYEEAKNIGAFINGAEFAQRWIPVDEELPKIYESVLVKFGVSNDIIVVAYYSEGEFQMEYSNCFDKLHNVTHWRPIDIK